MIDRSAGTVSSSSAVGEVSTVREASSGSHPSTPSSRPSPASTSCRAATLVIALVIDWIRMSASGRIGGPPTDAAPTATTSGSRSARPTTATAPGAVPASTCRWSRSATAELISRLCHGRADRLHRLLTFGPAIVGALASVQPDALGLKSAAFCPNPMPEETSLPAGTGSAMASTIDHGSHQVDALRGEVPRTRSRCNRVPVLARL